MKKLSILIFFAMSILTANAQFELRCFEKQIKLAKDPTSEFYYVQTKTNRDFEELKNLLSLEKGKSTDIIQMRANRALVKSERKLIQDNVYTSDIYISSLEDTLIVLPRIVVSLKDGFGIEPITKALGDNLSQESKKRNTYIFNYNVSNSEDVLKAVSYIDKFEGIDFCVPEMYGNCRSSDSNPLYSQQYYLENSSPSNYSFPIDINVKPAWNITNGNSNRVVAVIDDGIEIGHEDFGGRVLNGYTINNPTGYGMPQNYEFPSNSIWYDYRKAHGTACAGIIAASNNDKGIRGIASNVKLLPINIRPGVISTSLNNGFGTTIEIANAITWAYEHGADVISCSNQFPTDPYIIQAITNARSLGRNGKGCVFVVSSGNTGQNWPDVDFPANVNGVIAVGAVKKNGVIQDYSRRGPSQGLVAPSGAPALVGDVCSTDLTGTNGFTPYNYVETFGGTSASCPQVAGVAALVLSVNPSLTESLVRNLMYTTARDLGTTGWDSTYGYGLVNAYAAVSVAPYWQDCTQCTLTGNSSVCSSSTFTLAGVPSNATVSWRFEGQTSGSPNLYPNSSNNTCIVQAISQPFVGYLCADVKIQGYTIKTYRKQIEGGSGFVAYYWDNTEYMDVLWSDENRGTPGNIISVHSDYLVGKTVKTSVSSSPTNYTNLSILGTGSETRVEFLMPNLSGNEYLTLWVTGACDSYSFNFYPRSSNSSNNNLFQVNVQDENHYILSIYKQDSIKNSELNRLSDRGFNDSWVFRVFSATDLHQIMTQLVEDESFILDTSSWKPGVYIIRAYVNNMPYTTKITVK